MTEDVVTASRQDGETASSGDAGVATIPGWAPLPPGFDRAAAAMLADCPALGSAEVAAAAIAALRDERVPEDELRRTKDLRKGRLLMGFEDSRSVAAWIGSQESTYGEIKTPEEVMEKIDAVTAAEVQELARELFRPDRLSLALLGPYSDPQPFAKLLESL